MRYVILAVAVALAAAAAASGAGHKGSGSLHATLTGKVEVPKGDPDGAGTAEVKITGTKVCWEIKTARVATLTAAHIHRGGPGVAGPVVVPFGGAFKAKGCIATTAALAAAIERHPAAYYVNVHNATYPGGALRGQLRSDG
jgi:CHRD domain-containing protein